MGRGRGRGKGNRIQKKDFKETRENKWATAPASWEPAELNNADFEEYYKQQGVVPDGEWDAFMSSLRRTLPTTFRINGSGKFALDLRRKLETDFLADMVHGRVSGEIFQPPTPIPWYPDNLAWQLDASRNQLRKVSALARLHEFMKLENDAGGITRQEAVSMIPPLLLDVHPHHSVLDMCAAPGSKTFQLLEALHAGPAPATGLVIANDADVQRCNLLTHQVKRMCSSHLLVTNHEAQNFPSIRALGAVDREGGTLQFDRILCDVPCSGDGTMRKAPDIWRRWTASNGNGLHALQINITLRACQLLKEGGRLVYSTCTFNPIEDEAVVAEILRRTKGSMELVDVPELLPDLKRLPGVHQWKAFDKEKKAFYSTYAEAKEAGASKVDETMFADEASALLPLERCMRVLPHHGDTGGFFIAVFRKIAPVGDLPFRITNSRKRQQMNVDATTAEPAATVAAPVAASAAAAAAVAPAPEATTAAEPAEAPVEAPAPVEMETDAQPAVAEGGNVAADQAVAARAPVTAADPALVAATAVQPSTATGVEASAVVQPPKEVKQWGPVANRGGGGRGGGQNGAKWTGVDPVVFITDETILSSLIQFYGMGGPSETVVRSQLVTRSSDMLRPKRLYLVSVAVKELLAADVRNQLKVMSTGVKCFERQESKDGGVRCNYRISQEGLAVLLPLMSAQCFRPTVAEFQRLITERSVPAPMSAALVATDGDVAEMDVAKDDAEAAATSAASTEAAAVAKAEAVNARTPMSDLRTLAQLADVKAGCCVAILRNEDAVALDLPRESEEESALTAAAPVAVACYRGRGTVSVLVSKPECLVIQEKLRGALARAQAAADALVQPALAVVSKAEPMAVTGAVEGPVVVPVAGLEVAVEGAGDAAAEIPVEEMAAAVAIVGDKRSAEGEAAAEEVVPSKRAAL